LLKNRGEQKPFDALGEEAVAMTMRTKSDGSSIDRSLWERAYRYIFIQYPDPATARDFLVEALDQLELSKKIRLRGQKKRGWTLIANQNPTATQPSDPLRPALYSTPAASMPEVWRLLFFVSAVCASRGRELETREKSNNERFLARYVAYLLYITMNKSPDDRALVWGSILMSYAPTEVQNLIDNTNSSFRKRKQLYLAQVRERFGLRMRKVNRHHVIRGHSATSAEVHLIEAMAREFCSWLYLFNELSSTFTCPLFKGAPLNAEVFGDLARQRQREQKRNEIRAEGNGGAPIPSGRELDRLVEIGLQFPLFEKMRHVLACPDCQGFACLVDEWRTLLTPPKGRERFETGQNKQERQHWEAQAMKPSNKIIVPEFGSHSGPGSTGTTGGTGRKRGSLFSPPSLKAADRERIRTTLNANRRRRTAFVPLGPLQVLVNGKVRTQVRPGSSVVIKITESDEYIDVIGHDRKGTLLLATAFLPDFRELLLPPILPNLRIEWEEHSSVVAPLPVTKEQVLDKAVNGPRPHAAL
jgi:hypothetical protein